MSADHHEQAPNSNKVLRHYLPSVERTHQHKLVMTLEHSSLVVCTSGTRPARVRSFYTPNEDLLFWKVLQNVVAANDRTDNGRASRWSSTDASTTGVHTVANQSGVTHEDVVAQRLKHLAVSQASFLDSGT